MAEKPHFIARRAVDLSQPSSRLFCPWCEGGTVYVETESKFFEHVQREHAEIAADRLDSSRWREIVNEATSRARQKTTIRLAPDPAPPDLSKRSSLDSMKINVGDVGSRSTHSRPVSAFSTKQTGEANIEPDIKRLSLSQGPAAGAAGLIPLKRPANQTSNSEAKDRGEGQGLSKKGRLKEDDVEEFEQASRADADKQPFDRQVHTTNLERGRLDSRSQSRNAKQQLQSFSGRGTGKQIGADPQASVETPGDGGAASTGQSFENTNFNRVNISLEPGEPIDEWDADPELLLQPETRPISHDQLVHEVKGIYAGLVMVEAKCIDVDGKQTAAAKEKDPAKRTQLTPEQWSALIALHKTLLHEHHDFFLASQHPSASPALTKLAEKYSMPARMWKHGIHAFLEVLRLRLPGSLDHMLAFIYIAYSMMALLYETVPSFENTWIECLGDLGRYRMAIGDEDIKDRDVWSGVARFWYEKAAEKNPQIGRLHHHLAILARPYTMQQLSLYTRSLSAVVPFEGAKTSMATLLNPVFSHQELAQLRTGSVESIFTKCLAFLFTGRTGEIYDALVHQLVTCSFNKYIERLASRFKEVGVFAFLCAAGALLEFGSSQPKGQSRSLIRRAYEDLDRQRQTQRDDSSSDGASSQASASSTVEELSVHEIEESKSNIAEASKLFFGLLSVVLQRPQDKNVQPIVHAYLALIKNLASSHSAMNLLERDIPWSQIASYLNYHASSKTMTSNVLREEFPKPSGDNIGRPLPEDFVLRGQVFMEGYYPATWFSEAAVDDEERVMELPSMTAPRMERILWNGHCITQHDKWMVFNSEAYQFEETKFAREIRSSDVAAAAIDPSIASTEADTLVMDSVDNDRAPFDGSQPYEGSGESQRGQDKTPMGIRQELQPPDQVLLEKGRAKPQEEQSNEVEMKDTYLIKHGAVERSYARSKSQYRVDLAGNTTPSSSPAMFKNVKHYHSPTGDTGYIKIVDDPNDPSET